MVDEELRILIIEDSEDDAELLLWELRRGGFRPEWERVDTEPAMLAALERQSWDLVIADYVMPRFTGLAALQLLQERGIDLPFIVVSGKVGEETAVEAMKAGANDYFLKGQLARLVPAIRRELNEARGRQEQKRVEAELKLLKQAVETIPIGLTITDLERRILYTNPAEARMHGYTVDELHGEDVRILAPHDTWRNCSPADLKAMKSLSRESFNIRKDCSIFPAHIVSNVVTNGDGEPVAIISACEDISERKEAEETMRRQLAAMESSIDGIAIVDEEGGFVYVNQAFVDIFGYAAPADLQGRGWRVLFAEDEWSRYELEILTVLNEEERWRGEATAKRLDGSMVPVELSLTIMKEGGIVSVVRDITERKQAEERLRYLITHDCLTNLYNRAYFEEELGRLERSRLFPVSVVMADVDGLKAVNDTQGHGAGDLLLQQAANILMSVFRREDMVARIGGDEFVVLLPEADETVVENALQRIRETMGTFLQHNGTLAVSLSLGAATARESGRLMESVRLADERMYLEKSTHTKSR